MSKKITLKQALDASSSEYVDSVAVVGYAYSGPMDQDVTMTLADECEITFDQQQEIELNNGVAIVISDDGAEFYMLFMVTRRLNLSDVEE